MPLDIEMPCIYQINAEKGIKCESSVIVCKRCPHYKNVQAQMQPKKNIMTRAQAIEQIKTLYVALDKMIRDEEVLEDTRTALEFAITDMTVLQDILNRVDGITTK